MNIISCGGKDMGSDPYIYKFIILYLAATIPGVCLFSLGRKRLGNFFVLLAVAEVLLFVFIGAAYREALFLIILIVWILQILYLVCTIVILMMGRQGAKKAPASAQNEKVNHEAVPQIKLYSFACIDIATLFGSIFAGAVLISRNYRILGDPRSVRKTILLGIAATAVLSTTIFLIKTPAKYDKLIGIAIQSIQVAIIHSTAMRYQGNILTLHKKAGGQFYSRWRALGIAILVLPLTAAIFIIVNMFLLHGFLR